MRLIVLIVLAALSCVPARAQAPGSPEAQAAAKELTAIMSPQMIGQMTDAMTAQVWPKLEGALRAQVNASVLTEIRAEFEKSLKAFVVEAMKDAPTIYAKHFSAQELRDMAAFYGTPTGAKALRQMPQVTAEFFGTVLPRMEGFKRELQAIMTKYGVK